MDSFAFFCKSAFGIVVFFYEEQLFSLNGRLFLFSVKLCSSQKFMIGYIMSIIQCLWIYQIHVVLQCFCQSVKQMQKSQLLGKYCAVYAGSNYGPKTTSLVISNNLSNYLVKSKYS